MEQRSHSPAESLAYSIVVPAHDAAQHLPATLKALRDSAASNSEIVLVDDHSTDATAQIATQLGIRVVAHEGAPCPGLARNTGIEATSAPIVIFIDADVLVHERTLKQLHQALAERPEIAAVFGSYDDAPADPGLISQFKNLHHHFIHQQGSPDATTFWAGCAAVRRTVLEDLGGFRQHSLRCVEDIDLGHRMIDAGHRVWLKADVQAKHLKRWTLFGLVRTDVIVRGIPWTIMMRRRARSDTDLNLTLRHKLAAVLACLTIWFAFAAAVTLLFANPRVVGLVAATSGTCLAIFLLLTEDWYRFLLRKRGILFAIRSIPMHLLYYHYCVIAWILGNALWIAGRQGNERAARDAAVSGD